MKSHFKQIFFPASNKKIILMIIFFILNSSFLIHNCRSQSGWFYQPLPITEGQILDLRFFDENTGFVAIGSPFSILRTTNGGYNWYHVINNQYISLFDVIDSNTIYGAGAFANGHKQIIRSYNRGLSWDSIAVNVLQQIFGISFVNHDTGWIGGTSGGLPYICRTTNAGLNWTVQFDNSGYGNVFFLKDKVNGEYIGWSLYEPDATYKTTNSGLNWFQITNVGSVSKLYFVNENTGYASSGDKFKKTTNGGLNWDMYYLPTGNNIFTRIISSFKFVNQDTIYGDGGDRYFGYQKWREIIWISTNGGVNWVFQQPDTSINKVFDGIDFVNIMTGWSSNIRTNDGGGPIIITSINNLITLKPDDYILEQNYPNPFNSSTRINFSVPRPSYIILELYDISGKRAVTLYNNEFFVSGNYYTSLDISKTGLSSGIYFYRMTATDLNGSITFIQTRKCVYIK